MPHKIEISDKTYEELKEYCTLNKLKIGQYADKLVHEGLMIEMYGDTPFTDYKRKPVEIKQIEWPPIIPEEIPEVPFMKPESIEPPETKPEETLEYLRKEAEEITKVPREVFNEQPKIIKRRLK